MAMVRDNRTASKLLLLRNAQLKKAMDSVLEIVKSKLSWIAKVGDAGATLI